MMLLVGVVEVQRERGDLMALQDIAVYDAPTSASIHSSACNWWW